VTDDAGLLQSVARDPNVRKRRHYINDNAPSVTTKYAIGQKNYFARDVAASKRADNSRQPQADIRRLFPKFWMAACARLTQKTRPFPQNVEAFCRTVRGEISLPAWRKKERIACGQCALDRHLHRSREACAQS
jgi:hypothetical protein